MDFRIRRSTAISNADEDALGLYSARPYAAGDTVMILQGDTFPAPTRHTVQIAPGCHILDARAFFMNHSFDPTTVIQERHVRAVRDIEIGDELTFDYTTTETTLAESFVCNDVLVMGASRS